MRRRLRPQADPMSGALPVFVETPDPVAETGGGMATP